MQSTPTDNCAGLFRQYVDEADATFLSDQNVVDFLNLGWQELMTLSAELDSNAAGWTKTENYININADSLDLSNVIPAVGNTIMGGAPAADRLYRLMRVSRCEATAPNAVRFYLIPSRSLVVMRNDVNRFMLHGTQLLFNTIVDHIKVEYIGHAGSPFTIGNIVAGAGVYIDEISCWFWDLIVLLACKHYMIKDFAGNPILVKQMDARTRELKDYLSTGRSFAADSNVIPADEATYVGY